MASTGADRRTLAVYAARAPEFAGRFSHPERRLVLSSAEKIFDRTEKILELGCGSGVDAATLIDAGYDIVASDGSPQMLAEATRSYPQLRDRSCLAELPGPLPFDDQSFSGVIAIAVLQHLPFDAIRLALEEIYRILKVDGRFLTWSFAKRPDLDLDSRDGEGRLMTLLPLDLFEPTAKSVGFQIVSAAPVPDLFGRAGFETHEYVCLR